MKLDYSGIEPLDGSPMMSANCWNTILQTTDKHIAQDENPSFLEWGAGNSTISLVRKGLSAPRGFKLVSVEHETNFFHWLAESIIAELLDDTRTQGDVEMVWRPLQGPFIELSRLGGYLKRHKHLESPSVDLQIVLNTKRLSYIEGIKPDFSFGIFKVCRNSFKLLLLKLTYCWWVINGVLDAFLQPDKKLYELGEPLLSYTGKVVQKKVFFEFFEAHPHAGCLTLTKGKLKIELWHIPVAESIFWGRKTVLEGSIRQLADYVEVPLNDTFNVIFIDGRARASCIKRVHADNLLKGGGNLFVHDGFRAELLHAFRLFSNIPSFIFGSNETLNGQKRATEVMGMPLARIGKSIDSLEEGIAQELYVFQN